MQWLMFAISLTTMIMISCCDTMSRRVPTNYILLFTFTFAETYLVALLCTAYTANSCLACAVGTLALTVVLTIYALLTKRDFTTCGPFMAVIMFGMMFVVFAKKTIVEFFWLNVLLILYLPSYIV